MDHCLILVIELQTEDNIQLLLIHPIILSGVFSIKSYSNSIQHKNHSEH